MHIRRTAVSIMTTIIYGRRCPKYANSPAERFFDGTHLLNKVVDVFTHPPIDLIPALQYVPTRQSHLRFPSNPMQLIPLVVHRMGEMETTERSNQGHPQCTVHGTPRGVRGAVGVRARDYRVLHRERH